MLDFDYPEELTLANPTGDCVDGEPVYEEIPVRARLLRSGSHLTLTLPPQRQLTTAFLIRSPVAPRVGARLAWGSDSYDLNAVYPCCDLEGRLECYRCEC